MIETPGHTPVKPLLLSEGRRSTFQRATLLFCGSVGRTDFPEGSTAQIVESLHRLTDALPDETEVYPWARCFHH
ncbi:MAG: MBL fold metallo-hydrolase [Lachnospiraceae bacterium]